MGGVDAGWDKHERDQHAVEDRLGKERASGEHDFGVGFVRLELS